MAAPAAPVSAPAANTMPMTRREFLYYIWAASMALFLAEGGGAVVWFAVPRFKAGEFGGVFEIDINAVPPADSDPKAFDGGRFWLVNLGNRNTTDERLQKYVGTEPYVNQSQGVKAIYKICVHLGCLYKWVPTNDRFECPCHGSKYLSSGVRIGGPARRNLDVFVIQAVDANNTVVDETKALVGDLDGTAIDVDAAKSKGAVKLLINTGKRINGANNAVEGTAA
jgi:cytochrome b6-f complex iron-sulfur subunit